MNKKKSINKWYTSSWKSNSAHKKVLNFYEKIHKFQLFHRQTESSLFTTQKKKTAKMSQKSYENYKINKLSND